MSHFNFTSKSESGFTIKNYSTNHTGEGGNLPKNLKEYNQWLTTHDTPLKKDRHKSPKCPSEGWNEGGLLSFEEARNLSEPEDNTALAFRFTQDGPFVGFDLDDVTRGGEFTDEALGIVRRLNSYTEVSSSGTGLHVIAKGEKVDTQKSRGDLAGPGHLEVYDHSRYFVLTGDVYDGRTSVESRPTAVQEVQTNHLPNQQTFSFTAQQTPESERELIEGKMDITPEQVRKTIQEYAKGANVDEEVLRLWSGSNEARNSTSEADMAFAKQLYFWCRGNQQLMDTCFRASHRMRPKWDEVHYSNGDTYGERTLHKVCRSNNDTFDGRYVE